MIKLDKYISKIERKGYTRQEATVRAAKMIKLAQLCVHNYKDSPKHDKPKTN
jgi:hypothetical protein